MNQLFLLEVERYLSLTQSIKNQKCKKLELGAVPGSSLEDSEGSLQPCQGDQGSVRTCAPRLIELS